MCCMDLHIKKKEKTMNRIIKKGPFRLFAVTKALLLVSSCFVMGNLCAMKEKKRIPRYKSIDAKVKFINKTALTTYVRVYFPVNFYEAPSVYKIKSKKSKDIAWKKKRRTIYVVPNKVEIIARDGRKKYKKEFSRFFFKANREYSIIEKDSIVIEPSKKKYDSVESSKIELVSVVGLTKKPLSSEYVAFDVLPTKEEFEKKKLESFVNIKEDENDLTDNNTSIRRFFNKDRKSFTVEGSNFRTNRAIIEESDSYFDLKFKNEYFDKNKEYSIIFRSSSDRGISKISKISDLKSGVIYEISIVPFDIL